MLLKVMLKVATEGSHNKGDAMTARDGCCLK
jgi:hypothetical protein